VSIQPVKSLSTGGAAVASAFDMSLRERELRLAAEEYALRYGERGSPEFRSAWLRFRQKIRTSDDLRRWRKASAIRRNGTKPGHNRARARRP